MPPPPDTSSLDLPALAQKLRSLHIPGEPLILTNVYDASTANLVAGLPTTKALATASYAVAAAAGLPDADLDLETNLAGIAAVARGLHLSGKAAELPLTADLQDGYADVGHTIREAVKLGVVGCNLEDVDGEAARNGGKGRLRGVDEQVGRIREAVEAAGEMGVEGFVVNARTDCLGFGGNVGECVARGKRYLEAGAWCVFVWGVGKVEVTREMGRELVEGLGRVNLQPGLIGVRGCGEVGVSRVSVGPGLWRWGLEGVKRGVEDVLKS